MGWVALTKLFVVAPLMLAAACNAVFGVDELSFDGPATTPCSLATECPGNDGPCATRTCSGGSCGVDYAAADEPCEGGSCDSAGTCIPSGGPCATEEDCEAGGFCVDGRCCSSPCSAICESCDLLGTRGICTPIPAGEDPLDECADGACDGQGACFLCGNTAPPTGGSCPAACSQCNAGVCHIICDGADDCVPAVTCPDGWSCAVTCVGALSCFDTTITCPASGQSCSVECQGSVSCGGATILCGAGPCALSCSDTAESCSDTQLICGLQECSASCAGASTPVLVACGNACSCLTC